MANKKEDKKLGRPIVWTEEKKAIAIDLIINRLCEGESLTHILDYADRNLYPRFATFLKWVEENEILQKHYTRALYIRAERFFDEIISISDKTDNDILISDDGKIRVNHDVVNRDRLRVDTRKWVLSRMNPKKYGEKLDLTTKDKELQNTTIIVASEESKKRLEKGLDELERD